MQKEFCLDNGHRNAKILNAIIGTIWQQSITEFLPDSPEQQGWLSIERSFFFIEAYFM